MNNVAISPKIGMYALQNQNVERKIAKPIDIHKMTPINNDALPTIEEIEEEEDIKDKETK